MTVLMEQEISTSKLLLLAARVNLVTAILTGFLAYSMLATIKVDAGMFKDMFTKRTSVFVVINRATYFVARYVGMSYFVSAVIIGHGAFWIDCTAATRYNQVTFYVSLIANHALFALRMLATWRGHKSQSLVEVYCGLGMAAMIVAAIMNIRSGGLGTVVSPYGCVYIVDTKTLPTPVLSGVLVGIGISYHTINMVLAALRLSNSGEEGDPTHRAAQAWATLSQAVLVKPTIWSTDSHVRRSQTSVKAGLGRTLLAQGFHYWFMRLISLVAFIVVPIFAMPDDATMVMTGLACFTAVDIELGGRTFRQTVLAVQEATAAANAKSHALTHCPSPPPPWSPIKTRSGATEVTPLNLPTSPYKSWQGPSSPDFPRCTHPYQLPPSVLYPPFRAQDPTL